MGRRGLAISRWPRAKPCFATLHSVASHVATRVAASMALVWWRTGALASPSPENEDHIIDARECPLQATRRAISSWQAPACGLDVRTMAITSWPSGAPERWRRAAARRILGRPRSRLTHTYLSGYTSINSQSVIDPKMPNAHDLLFSTLADPTRRAILERLCREGEQTVGALTARAGVSQPAVSKHLGVLKQAGLVRDRHEGRQTHYSAQVGALAPLIDWTSQMAGFWQSRFDHLEDLLKRMDQ